MTKYIKIGDIKEIASPGFDGIKYRFSYQIGDMEGTEFRPQKELSTTVSVSGTLQAVWGTTPFQTISASGTLAASTVLDSARQGQIGEKDEIRLNTYSAPHKPPTSPVILPGVILPIPDIPDIEQGRGKEAPISFLSDDISEIRDNINTLCISFLGDRLLLLPQERALFDMYKPVSSVEAFRTRIQSLAGISISLNKLLMGNILEIQDFKDIGEIKLLENLLKKYSDETRASTICEIFKRLIHLRKGYPVHGNNIETIVPAHDYFGIPYPVTDFEAAWEIILAKYFQAMKEILDIIQQARKKSKRG